MDSENERAQPIIPPVAMAFADPRRVTGVWFWDSLFGPPADLLALDPVSANVLIFVQFGDPLWKLYCTWVDLFVGSNNAAPDRWPYLSHVLSTSGIDSEAYRSGVVTLAITSMTHAAIRMWPRFDRANPMSHVITTISYIVELVTTIAGLSYVPDGRMPTQYLFIVAGLLNVGASAYLAYRAYERERVRRR
jgi:hypothetical protein